MQFRKPGLRIVCALVCTYVGVASAQPSYPTKPIRLIVTLGPGSTVDLLARTVGDQLSRQLGQPVLVENRAGAGGMIAAETVARASPDGYTLLTSTIGTHGINPGLHPKMAYDAIRDFAPITLLASSPNVLIVGNDVPAQSVAELIAHIKSKGEFAYSSGGTGTSMHLAGELFSSMIGVKGLHVPYKASPEAVASVMKGEVMLMFPNAPNAIGPARGGRLRAIAATPDRRISWWAELPTVAEAGLAGFDVTAWFGLTAPAGTPDPIIRRLHEEAHKALAVAAVRDALVKQGFEVLTSTPEGFAQFIRAELAKWERVIKTAGIKPE